MKLNSISLLVLLVALSGSFSVRADDVMKKEVVASYVAIAAYSTADAHAQAVALKAAVGAFTAAPSEELQMKAKDAWLAARLPYLQSALFRMGGELVVDLDGVPGDFMASVEDKAGGFAAIELLLWGEDGSVDTAGVRTHEDFLKEKGGEALRRVEYLNASAALVEEQLAEVAKQWKLDGSGDERKRWLAMPVEDGLKGILESVSTLAERVKVEGIGKAYESRDEKDESANFSDTTHLDLIYVCSGMANVVAGAYVGIDQEVRVQGAGLLQLATAVNAQNGEALKLAINRVMLAVTDFRPPFDRALMAPDDSPAREAIKEMMDGLEEFGAKLGEMQVGLGFVEPAAAASE